MLRIDTPAESSIDLVSRLSACWRLKLALLVGLTIGYCVPYIYLSRYSFHPPLHLPLTSLDRIAGFDPRWVWAYQSLYLLTSTLPLLATSSRQLRIYVLGFAMMVGICFPIFFFFPVAGPRPAGVDAGAMYATLIWYDGPNNAFPSMHAALLYYTLAFARRIVGPVPYWLIAILVFWAAAILWATLATKQHYAVDLLAGIALAAVCDAAAWSKSFRSDAEKSHVGVR